MAEIPEIIGHVVVYFGHEISPFKLGIGTFWANTNEIITPIFDRERHVFNVSPENANAVSFGELAFLVIEILSCADVFEKSPLFTSS